MERAVKSFKRSNKNFIKPSVGQAGAESPERMCKYNGTRLTGDIRAKLRDRALAGCHYFANRNSNYEGG